MSVRCHILDVYGVHLHLATNRRQWATLRRRWPSLPTATDEYGSVQHPGSDDGYSHFAIFIDVERHDDTGRLLDTCAHEATHLSCQILDDTETKYDAHSEPLAYLVGWLTRWLWEAT